MRRFEINGDVTDGAIVSERMPIIYSALRVAVDFFDVSGDKVSPTDGAVSVDVSIDGVTWEDIPGGVFSAVDTYRKSRLWPECAGDARYCRVTLSGIVGAVTYRATIMRHE